MMITELPTADLLRLFRASERASDPDAYALAVLRQELERRLNSSGDPDSKTPDKEVTPCK